MLPDRAAWRSLETCGNLVSNSLFWCAGSWNLTKRQVSKLRGLQLDMLHKMVSLQRLPNEADDCFMTRLNSKIKRLKLHYGHEDWDQKYWTISFRWAGHVARMERYCKERITYQVFLHKNWEWIIMIQDNNSGNQLHCRRLKVWRWEAPFYTFFGRDSWQNAAQDKATWDSHLDKMISWRRR